MSYGTPAIGIAFAVCTISATAIFAQSSTNDPAVARSRYLPQYAASGELILPKNSIWREWVFVGSPLTPNALNDGHASFPEYHNVYIEPGSYAIYEKTHVFPEGTVMFKELQLTVKPEENSDGSRTEASGRGYFPGAYNGADVTVKDTKRFAASGGWGFFDFNHFEPKAPTAKVRAKSECAFCHIAGAKKDQVWTQFYSVLDK
jgi:Cytochrome P460